MAVAPPEANERRGVMNSAIVWAPDSSSVSDRLLLSYTLRVIVFLGKHSFHQGFQGPGIPDWDTAVYRSLL